MIFIFIFYSNRYLFPFTHSIFLSLHHFFFLLFVFFFFKMKEFKTAVMQSFQSFTVLMSKSKPTLIAAQTNTLKNFSHVLHDLCKIYHIIELADIGCTLINSSNYDEQRKQLNLVKLGLLHKLVVGSFYRDVDTRAVLMPTLLNTLVMHLDKSEEEMLECVSVLGTLLDLIQTEFEVTITPSLS